MFVTLCLAVGDLGVNHPLYPPTASNLYKGVNKLSKFTLLQINKAEKKL